MEHFDYDLFVIGAGSGGVRASRVAAQLGAKVAVAEVSALGGTCVNVGCVPKKLFVYASHFAEDFEDARGFGWSLGERSFDWSTLIENKDAEIKRLNGVYGRLLDQSGVERIEGRARFVDAHTIAVGTTNYRAKYILVATGGRPFVPEIEGHELAISSDECFRLPSLPKRIVIVGGGYIAVEFAGIFHGLGVEVTQLYRGSLFLRGFDDDLRGHLAEEMRRQNIDLRFDCNVTAIEKDEGRKRCRLTDGSSIVCDEVLMATGRVPNVDGLGLETVGVKQRGRGVIIVDEDSRTNVDSVFAVGDVTDRINLTPVALAEGSAVAQSLFGEERVRPDHENVPSAVFSSPPMGTVGLTEGEAREKFGAVDVYRSSFRALKNTLSGREEKTLMKLVVDTESQRVVGCHMVGPAAGEIIQGFAVAIKMGATKGQFDATIGIHPTSAEEFVTMRKQVE